MRNVFFVTIMLLLFFFTVPAVAADKSKQHSGHDGAGEQMGMAEADASVQQMQEMRKMIGSEKDPAKRQKLMHQHMQMMHEGMNMMPMMGDQKGMIQGNMMNKSEGVTGDTSAAMAERMKTMEKHMKMMQEMMQGMMMHQKIMEEKMP